MIENAFPEHGQPLESVDAETLGLDAAREAEHYLAHRDDHAATPLHSLSGMAREMEVGAIHVKDESFRLGMGSFKALGGSYAVIRLALEAAGEALGRTVDFTEMESPDVRRVTESMTVGCATDGNHGRSVAVGARLVGARAVIFLHAGVSHEREQAIADSGARIIRIDGNYDDSVAEAERICGQNGWTVVSDTSWPGYERVPGLVMQGYTAMLSETVRALPQPPTHVFVQAGVGGLAATVAGHLGIVYGANRPTTIVVEPDRAACLHASAVAGKLVKVDGGESTIMAMLECYEPSLVAWRVLTRTADAFMTIGEDEAAAAMRRLARPARGDTAIVSGESGGAGLAGLVRAIGDTDMKRALGLDGDSRILLFNTEGATDRARYEAIVGVAPDRVLAAA